jgi:hypothetical protein
MLVDCHGAASGFGLTQDLQGLGGGLLNSHLKSFLSERNDVNR